MTIKHRILTVWMCSFLVGCGSNLEGRAWATAEEIPNVDYAEGMGMPPSTYGSSGVFPGGAEEEYVYLGVRDTRIACSVETEEGFIIGKFRHDIVSSSENEQIFVENFEKGLDTGFGAYGNFLGAGEIVNTLPKIEYNVIPAGFSVDSTDESIEDGNIYILLRGSKQDRTMKALQAEWSARTNCLPGKIVDYTVQEDDWTSEMEPPVKAEPKFITQILAGEEPEF